MPSNSPATIILMVKDRRALVLRWLTYMSVSNCDYKIIIADGGYTKLSKTDLDRFNNKLDLLHLKKITDANYESLIKKINYALKFVKTKFTIIADDDDFISTQNIDFHIKFLSNNPEFSSSGGQKLGVFGFNNGKYGFIKNSYSGAHSSEPVDRISSFLNSESSAFYNINKTEILLRASQHCRESKIWHPRFFELYVEIMIHGSGKVNRNGLSLYVKSFSHGAENSALLPKVFFNEMFETNWSIYCAGLINFVKLNYCRTDESFEIFLTSLQSFMIRPLLLTTPLSYHSIPRGKFFLQRLLSMFSISIIKNTRHGIQKVFNHVSLAQLRKSDKALKQLLEFLKLR